MYEYLDGNKEQERFCNQVLTLRNSQSEPDLATADREPSKSGFPPGTTVDELWQYRRKRPPGNSWPRNNIELDKGTFEPLKSEYNRRFRNHYYDFGSCGELPTRKLEVSPVRAEKPSDHLKVEGLLDFLSEYTEQYIIPPTEEALRQYQEGSSSFEILDSNANEIKEEKSDAGLTEININTSKTERHPLRRSTNIALEGDFHSTTEQAEKFVDYLLTGRPELIRKDTTLKLEGDMEIKTENREKFVPLDYQARPALCKKLTNLHLEGIHHILTEKQEQYVRYDFQKRPPLTKTNTNLCIEGDLDLLPEYRKEYIEYKTERRQLALPVNNLKTDGFHDVVTDSSHPFHHQIHPQIPFLRGADLPMDDVSVRSRMSPRRRESGLRTYDEKKWSAKAERPRVLELEGSIDMNPEYRNAYVDFNKGEAPLSRTRRSVQHHNLKTEGKMDINPEYSSSYVDFPRGRPKVNRPECSLSSEGEMDHTTEQNEKFVPFPGSVRTGSLKREPELKLEGHFECQPEYRKAYIDYLTRERVERKPRPLDHLGSPTKRAIEEVSMEKTVLNVPILLEPNSSNERKSARNRSLSQIEQSAFGPKLTLPKGPSSRSSSPTPSLRRKSRSLPRSRKSSITGEESVQNSTDSDASRQRRFGHPVRVENLVRRTATSLVDVPSGRNKWMRDSSTESSSAFVVLDDRANNNYSFDCERGRVGRRGENKWYNPSS